MSISIDELIEEEFKATRSIEESKKTAEEIISKAKKKAQEHIDQATKTENITSILKKEEEKTNKEAEKILEEYKKKIAKYQKIPQKAFDQALDLAVKEVLKFE